jgi:hypothetical protein
VERGLHRHRLSWASGVAPRKTLITLAQNRNRSSSYLTHSSFYSTAGDEVEGEASGRHGVVLVSGAPFYVLT